MNKPEKIKLWRAQCFSCSHVGQGREVRHEAQAEWNGVDT